MKVGIGATQTISHLQEYMRNEDWSLLVDSQDADDVKEFFGNDPVVVGYDSFFVLAIDGDYAEVWGFVGSVPYLSKLATQILWSYD